MLKQVFLRVEGHGILAAPNLLPGTRIRELARLHVVFQLRVHIALYHLAAGGVEHGVGNLHAVLGVARHHIGGRKVHDIVVNAEGVHAGML